MLIKNVKIHTMADKVIENGFIWARDGVIAQVGEMAECPQTADSEPLDAAGLQLYPGFVDAHCHIGLFGDALGFEGEDGNEETDPCTPQLRAIDAINPMDRCFGEALDAGITTVVTGPGSANAIGGQMLAMATHGTCVDEMLVKAPLAMKMALGENPKTVYNSKNQAPVTRMATAALIREQLLKARQYGNAMALAKEDSAYDEPDYDMKAEALLPVLRGEIPVHFHAHRCDDIYTGIRLAKEFGLRYTLVHATQGYRIAQELAKQGVKVLAGPLLCDRSKPELADLTPAAPAFFSKAGIPFAIVTDHPVIPIQYLQLSAALAVREGLDAQEALKAITCYPARICGIEDRVGSVVVGKEANFVLFRGSPLDILEKPKMVICRGKRVR